MWLSLLMDMRVWLGAALIAVGIYAKVQNLEKQQAQATLDQFRADVESEAAKSKVAAAQEAARQSQAAQEVLGDLQTRYAALNARYRGLRDHPAGSGIVPAVPEATTGTSPIAGSSEVADADARCLAVLETADREIVKYRALWELQLRNSGSAL